MPDSLPFQQINTQIATGNSVQNRKKKPVLAHKGSSGAYALPILSVTDGQDTTVEYESRPMPGSSPSQNPFHKLFHESAKADNKNALIGYIHKQIIAPSGINQQHMNDTT